MLISLPFLRERPLQRFRRCDDRRVLVFLSRVFAEKRENQPTARSSRTPSLFVLDSSLPFLREPVICVRQRHSHITRGKLRTTRNALFSQRRSFDATSSRAMCISLCFCQIDRRIFGRSIRRFRLYNYHQLFECANFRPNLIPAVQFLIISHSNNTLFQ